MVPLGYDGSKPLEELAEERRAVARAIAALRLTPVMFDSGAGPSARSALNGR